MRIRIFYINKKDMVFINFLYKLMVSWFSCRFYGCIKRLIYISCIAVHLDYLIDLKQSLLRIQNLLSVHIYVRFSQLDLFIMNTICKWWSLCDCYWIFMVRLSKLVNRNIVLSCLSFFATVIFREHIQQKRSVK